MAGRLFVGYPCGLADQELLRCCSSSKSQYRELSIAVHHLYGADKRNKLFGRSIQCQMTKSHQLRRWRAYGRRLEN
jgi:hypothetical protein